MRRTATLALAAVLALAGCAGPEPEPDAPAERHELHGQVVQVDRDRSQVTIAHEAIPDYMSAMTMPFNVRDAWVLDAAEPGAQIRATLVVQGTSSWIEDVVISKPASAGSAADAVVPQPHPGDEVPVVPLVDQDGRPFDLTDLRGRWLALTFIYTRCPLPDFCPRMSEQFRTAFDAIGGDPERYGDALLLSITVDPDYDTPAVLREYGLRYLSGAGEAGFERWRFARAEPSDLVELGRFCGLRTMPEGMEVVHNLRTLVVDPEGRVALVLVGNTWTPEELLGGLADAVAAR